MKFKNGDQCYFDILGRTNKNKTLTVTIVKKRMFGQYIVISDQTKEIFSVNKKHLTPINPDNKDMFFIRKTNPLISFDFIDYSLLKNIMNTMDVLYEDYLSKLPKHKILNSSIQEIKRGINIILTKMSIILKNEEEHEVVKNLVDRDYKSELSVINDVSNNSSNYSFYDNKDLLMNFMIEFRTKFEDPFDIYSTKPANCNSEINDYFDKNFPKKLFDIPKNYSHDFVLVTKCDIEDKSKRIFRSLQEDRQSLDGIIIPYIDKSSNKVKTMLFDEANSFEEIRDTISSIFIDEYDGKIPFNILIIFDTNIDEFLNDNEEEDEYE